MARRSRKPQEDRPHRALLRDPLPRPRPRPHLGLEGRAQGAADQVRGDQDAQVRVRGEERRLPVRVRGARRVRGGLRPRRDRRRRGARRPLPRADRRRRAPRARPRRRGRCRRDPRHRLVQPRAAPAGPTWRGSGPRRLRRHRGPGEGRQGQERPRHPRGEHHRGQRQAQGQEGRRGALRGDGPERLPRRGPGLRRGRVGHLRRRDPRHRLGRRPQGRLRDPRPQLLLQRARALLLLGGPPQPGGDGRLGGGHRGGGVRRQHRPRPHDDRGPRQRPLRHHRRRHDGLLHASRPQRRQARLLLGGRAHLRGVRQARRRRPRRAHRRDHEGRLEDRQDPSASSPRPTSSSS